MIEFDAQYFDPKATIECGQIFRYNKLGEDDYEVFSLDKRCRVQKKGSSVRLQSDDVDYFCSFFDLSRDYADINNRLLGFDELREAAEYGKGIRILRQSLYECIISFIISANNNIPRIRGIIERICAAYGKKMQGYNAFPTLNSLKNATKEEFRAIGAGFRDTYLQHTSNKLATLATVVDGKSELDDLLFSSNEMAYKLLCSLKGVGPKVADCIMLFGLARLDRFPVDVWMFRTLKSNDLDTPKKVRDYYSQRYGEYAGIAQQYIFYFAREKNKFTKI